MLRSIDYNFKEPNSVYVVSVEGSGRPKDIRLCAEVKCSLYPYRLGRNPARLGIGGRKACFS